MKTLNKLLTVSLIWSAMIPSLSAQASDLTQVSQSIERMILAADNPFHEGTEKKVLTDEESKNLLEYAENSRTKLEQALEDAKDVSMQEALSIYQQVILRVIQDSYKDKQRTELLMRYALNQGLDLVYGIPKIERGQITGWERYGVLIPIQNWELNVVVLEDSIKMAIEYYQDDKRAIESKSLVQLPFMRFAQDRLVLVRKWAAGVTESEFQYALTQAALYHWMSAAANEEQLSKAKFAEEITLIDRTLKSLTGYLSELNIKDVMVRLRKLRGVVNSVLKTTAEKLGAPIPVPGRPGSGGTSQGPVAEMKFVSIRAGTFTMGSPSTESGRWNNETQHQVTLTRDFEMMTTEVTQKQWVEVMGNNPSYFKGDDRPVESVSWNDVQDFITKLNQKNDGYTYRLPTEAEWEYSARAGSTTAYSYGDGEGSLGEYAWFYGNSGSETHAVATKKPNSWGLYDMHGNVWEWTSDWYGSLSTSSVTDPTGASSGSYRVIRGGGWSSYAQYLRSAYRNYWEPGNRINNVGFRLVRQ